MKRLSPQILSITLIVVGAMSLSACSTTQGTTPMFRHVALRALPSPGQNRATVAAPLELPEPKLRHEQRCTRSFRHPVLNRCDTWPAADSERPQTSLACNGDRVACRLALAERARVAMRSQENFSADRSFRRDCSGFVLSVLAAHGAEPLALFGQVQAGENGVAWMYRGAKERGWLHRHRVPAIGDLVFFSNTHDRNRDGRPNDLLTHVGIVEKVDPDGTVTFIHRVRRGTLRYRMNLFQPDQRRDPKSNKVLNHHLRLIADDGQPRLTGELFHAFATLLPDQDS